MIISGGARSNWRFFAKHLMKREENERVTVTEIRGLAGDSVLQGFREMDAVAGGTRVKNFFYHANLNPREDETLTPEQWEQAVDRLEKNLGLEGQSRLVVEHEKLGRTHRHVIWSRIDPDSMTAISDSQNYAKHAATSRELEQEFNLAPVRNVLMEPDGPRPERRPRNWETFRGHKSGIDPLQVKAEVSEIWHSADSGKAFRTAMAQHGYVLAQGDRRDFVIIDPAGHEHSLARRINGAKAADIRERLADIDRDTLPMVAGGRKERREDKQKVLAAMESGADKKRIESAINATRASEVSPVEPMEITVERESREAYEKGMKREEPENKQRQKDYQHER